MLYPKKNLPFDRSIFENPGSEYRAAPFWAWNNKLDKDELNWQIEQLKKMGFGGFHMHVRTGMATPYLTEEYMDIVKSCVEKARKEEMLAYLYDEDRWPSGAAGGIITKDHAHRLRFLLLSRHEPQEGELIGAYDVELNPDGTLKRYDLHKAGKARGFLVYASMQTAKDDPWYNNQAYVNTLDKASIQAFIHATYDRYLATVGEDFGGLVPSIFTDEPQFSRKNTLNFATDERDVTLPWTFDLCQTFRAAYGEDLIASLPELFWDLPDGKLSLIRYHYHDHIAERFASAFADQCGAWCEAHGLMLTGHMMEEPTLESQTHSLGEAMRSYRGFQFPGIDMLCDAHEFTTAKQAQSASRQFGREGVLSELYGVTNWDFDFRGHKHQGDWQAALGVTLRVPHLSWVSMNGEAKRDYPASISYQSPWYEQYAAVEDHFARLNTVLTRGKALCRVAVIHPVESYWLHWGTRETTQAIRQQKDEQFLDLTNWLLRGLIDFDFVSESLLAQQFTASAKGFQVGCMNYETVVVPPIETIRATTVQALEKFAENGGRVIFTGSVPRLMDAVESDVPARIFARGESISFDRVSILNALASEREIEIRGQSGSMTDNILYQLREEGAERWLFFCHADKSANMDVASCQNLQVRLRGRWKVELLDTMSGAISKVDAELVHGWTICHFAFYDHDSVLLHLIAGEPEGVEEKIAPEERKDTNYFLNSVPVTLSEPNVLLLDMPEYALNDEPWRAKEEVLRLDNILRKELGWFKRGNSVAQPWVVTDTTTPHTLRLRYEIRSEAEIIGARLALENAEASRVTLNGEEAGKVEGWYVDKCIGCRTLPAIHKGINMLEVRLPYGQKVDVEACYLLGDFSVSVRGRETVLGDKVTKLHFGNIVPQGLPFYGGNITYHLETELTAGEYELEISQYRGALMRVALDGKDEGTLIFSPYRKNLTIAEGGCHRLDVTLYGTRVNTFGQMHITDKKFRWWGPNSWRTTGALWSYEYQMWTQGILKSPELRRIER